MFEELLKKALGLFKFKKDANYSEIYDELIKECKKVFNEKEIVLIKKAYLVARDLHKGQKRNSGEPYIIHPVYVAYILLTEMNLHDANSIAAALLHDTREDCGITYEYLVKHFNNDVANLVEGVTKMKNLNFNTKEEKEEFNNYLLLKHILQDYRVIYIKLADRLHNMRTLDYKSEVKRREKSAESLRIFAPLATHVGASIAKEELVDTSFKYLNNRSYREIKGMRKDYEIKHQAEIEERLESLRHLLSEQEKPLDVRPQIMNNFAIYQGLINNKKISLLPNLIFYNIMVDTEEEIELVVKKIMGKYEVMPEFTEDFIKNPRNNGYRAIHLSIKGHKQTPYQIRIYTKEMFLVNTYGFSALLDIYPDKTIKDIQKELIRNNKFFQSLDRNYNSYKKPFKLIDETVRELLSDKINVYVANGAVYCLPAVSIVADLADKIHSDLKKEAIGALVNGELVSLDFLLKDNDRVVILTRENEINLSLESSAPKLILEKK